MTRRLFLLPRANGSASSSPREAGPCGSGLTPAPCACPSGEHAQCGRRRAGAAQRFGVCSPTPPPSVFHEICGNFVEKCITFLCENVHMKYPQVPAWFNVSFSPQKLWGALGP